MVVFIPGFSLAQSYANQPPVLVNMGENQCSPPRHRINWYVECDTLSSNCVAGFFYPLQDNQEIGNSIQQTAAGISGDVAAMIRDQLLNADKLKPYSPKVRHWDYDRGRYMTDEEEAQFEEWMHGWRTRAWGSHFGPVGEDIPSWIAAPLVALTIVRNFSPQFFHSWAPTQPMDKIKEYPKADFTPRLSIPCPSCGRPMYSVPPAARHFRCAQCDR